MINIEGTGNRIRPASKEVQRERAVARIEQTTLEDLQPSFEARREFGPQYGYADAAEWWQAMKSTYGLDDELMPDFVADAPTDPVVDFVQNYDGDDGFVLSLQNWLKRGRSLSPKQYAAAERSMGRQTIKSEPIDTDDPVLKFVSGYEGTFEFLVSLRDQLKAGRTLSDRQYSGAAKCMARESQKAGGRSSDPRQTVTEGMYRVADGTIYKVQRAVNGSGNLYAKKLVRDVVTGNVFGAVDQGRWKFAYEKGAVNQLKLEDKMTIEQAREFGALYGTCMVCGRTLTDEVSIAHGIGPICEGRMVEWA